MGAINYIACRRMSLLVEDLQQQPVDGQFPDRVVERVFECGPGVVMEL